MQSDVGDAAPAGQRNDSDGQQAGQMPPTAGRFVTRAECLGVMRSIGLVGVIRSRGHWMRLLSRGQAWLLILKGHNTDQNLKLRRGRAKRIAIAPLPTKNPEHAPRGVLTAAGPRSHRGR